MGRHKKDMNPSNNLLNKDQVIEESDKTDSSITSLHLVSSGSTLLNLALTNTLNGGYGIGRIVNVVGDKAVGKSLIAIELVNQVLLKIAKEKKIKCIYNETEAAFDKELAKELGMPVEQVEFRQSKTVEDWYKDLIDEVNKNEKLDLIIYILDSLDALSDTSEMEREIDKSSFGAEKAKKLSELFRRLIREIGDKNIILLIISQTRDKIGITFGEKKTRSGGKALDFYASQIIWLAEIEKLKKADRVVGIGVKAKVKKNKLGKPFREAEFPVLFGYGIDDLGSCIDFLKENKICISGNRFEWNEKTFSREDFIKFIEDNNLEMDIRELVKATWDHLEEASKIIRKPKY